MTCRLCGHEAELQKSHIIPEFLFTDLYDNKHRMHILSTELKKPRPYEQKGLREKLLCSGCETKFSKYETFARSAFDGKKATRPVKNAVVVKDVEYKRFKLFFLSILWRASISKLQFFKEVNLGPHEDIIKNMLLKEAPGPIHVYPMVAFALIEDNALQSGLITQPSKVRVDGHVGYKFIYGGFMWVYTVTSTLIKTKIPVALTEDNTFCFIESDYSSCGVIRDFAIELKRMKRI